MTKKKNWLIRWFEKLAETNKKNPPACGGCGSCKPKPHYNRWRRK